MSIQVGIPATEPCTFEDCGTTCWQEPWGFVHEQHVNGADVEAYCRCEHHELPPR